MSLPAYGPWINVAAFAALPTEYNFGATPSYQDDTGRIPMPSTPPFH